uniref:Replication-associated protein n=1 Tax=Phoenicurus auroreus Genomoviridae sp. TaxID=2814988 RepID=A0A8A4XC99_9VIRU
MPEFACNARYFLVTYPQCGDLCGFAVMERFSSLGAECIVAREHHEDGGFHLHCFADFGRKFRSRATDIFDVLGHHPNIEPSKGTPEKGYDYAIKDGDVIAGGLERPIGTSRTGGRTTLDKWTEITSAPDRDSFWELCHELDPKSTACSFGQLSKYADWKYADKPANYESPRGLDFIGGDVDGRDEWVQSTGVGLGQSFVDLSLSSCMESHGLVKLCGLDLSDHTSTMWDWSVERSA